MIPHLLNDNAAMHVLVEALFPDVTAQVAAFALGQIFAGPQQLFIENLCLGSQPGKCLGLEKKRLFLAHCICHLGFQT